MFFSLFFCFMVPGVESEIQIRPIWEWQHKIHGVGVALDFLRNLTLQHGYGDWFQLDIVNSFRKKTEKFSDLTEIVQF